MSPGSESRIRPRSGISLRTAGLLLIALGVTANYRVMGALFSPDRAVASVWTHALILLLQASLVALGGAVLLCRRSLRWATILLVIASACGSLVLCEALLRLSYRPAPIMSGWRSFCPPHELNQLGFRGRPIPGTGRTIVLLGDSHAEAAGCPFDSMPERRLERHLRAAGHDVTIATLGTGGYGQDQQLLVLREYFATYRATMVLVWFTPENDVWNNLFPTHWPRNGMVKPTFVLRNGRLAGPTERSGELILSSPLRIAALVKQTILYRDRDGLWDRLLPKAYIALRTWAGPVDSTWEAMRIAGTGSMPDEDLIREKSHRAVYLTPRSDRMNHGIALTRALLKEIEETARRNGARLVVFCHAPPESASPDETVKVLGGRYYRTSRQQYRDNVEDILEGFTSLTLPVTEMPWSISPADPHLNARATDQMMRDLAARLYSCPGNDGRDDPEPR